jgi:hypothetical protein
MGKGIERGERTGDLPVASRELPLPRYAFPDRFRSTRRANRLTSTTRRR